MKKKHHFSFFKEWAFGQETKTLQLLRTDFNPLKVPGEGPGLGITELPFVLKYLGLHKWRPK